MLCSVFVVFFFSLFSADGGLQYVSLTDDVVTMRRIIWQREKNNRIISPQILTEMSYKKPVTKHSKILFESWRKFHQN